MPISPTTTAPVPTSQPAPAALGGASADFSMFLRLLTTQMQNQDPLDPLDTSQYTQQLVQYSQVEQSIQQTSLLKNLLASQATGDLLEAASLIGKTVEIGNGPVTVNGKGGGAEWRWSAPGAARVEAEVQDATGRTVRSFGLLPGSAGMLPWDGRLGDGSAAPAGAYRLTLSAFDAAGSPLPPTVQRRGTVSEIITGDEGISVRLGGDLIPLKQIVSVTAA